MASRLLPWAVLATIVAALAFFAPAPETVDPAAAPARETGTGSPALEVRLGPVDMRELHDDGSWNRLEAVEAVYSYGRRTVAATAVAVSLGTGKGLSGSVIRAPRAFWDFDGQTVDLPEGARADREGGWKGEFSFASLDLDGRILRVPGRVSLSGPGLSVSGENLRWGWPDGKVTMDAPASRIAPASVPGGKRG